MTCIVGLAQPDGRIIMGGDSAGVAWMDLSVRADDKVFELAAGAEPMILGFTTSFRMGQVLRYAFAPPAIESWDVDRYMATHFIDGVRAALKAAGWTQRVQEREEGGEFLVGVRGLLYRICGDFQIGRRTDPWEAVGCGAPYALGALAASSHVAEDRAASSHVAEDRVRTALAIAERYSAGVRGPFVVKTVQITP